LYECALPDQVDGVEMMFTGMQANVRAKRVFRNSADFRSTRDPSNHLRSTDLFSRGLVRPYFLLPVLNRSHISLVASLFLLVLCMSANTAQAQFGSIRGIVFDAELRDELPGATVMLDDMDGEKKYIITGTDGLFAFHRLFPGKYAVEVSFVGFLSYLDTMSVALGEDVYLEARLIASEIELDEVVVETVRTESDRYVAGLNSILPGDLTRIPMPDVSYDLA
jgi:hypothetical protein